MSELAEHRPKSSDLPEEPLNNFILGLGILRQVTTGLFREVEKNGTTFKDRNWFAVRSVGINQSRDLIVRLKH